jgi:heme/copper-type cytochrome/quinol oxidase subunit 2
MMLALFNIFSLVSYVLYVVVIFEFYMVQIYRSGLSRHDPTKTRRVLELGWTTVFTLLTDTT